MKLTTSKGKTCEALMAWGPLPGGEVMIRLRDDRPLSRIARDFEGCEVIRREGGPEGDAAFEGYTRLTGVNRQTLPDEAVLLTLARPEGGAQHGD